MTFRSDTSFPYLAVARRFDVPYADVLAFVEGLEGHSLIVTTTLRREVCDDIDAAWRRENRRRCTVITESVQCPPPVTRK